ncbi:universal stress protein [Arthrobacter monumenti]
MSVVVGYIPTAEGTAALERAIEEARDQSTQLIVVNSSRSGGYPDRHHVDAGGAAALKEKLESSGVEHSILQKHGDVDAAEEVLHAAEEYKAELIVIGLRKRTPVGKLIMGSTSQRILLEAPCPVLAVKAVYS